MLKQRIESRSTSQEALKRFYHRLFESFQKPSSQLRVILNVIGVPNDHDLENISPPIVQMMQKLRVMMKSQTVKVSPSLLLALALSADFLFNRILLPSFL